MDDGEALASAWSTFCRRVEALGARLATGDFPGSDADRAEGFHHLTQQLMCWLGWAVHHSDPAAPKFQRQNDLVTKWGGPNVDNVYRHARIDHRYRYRIHGHMHGCEDFVLALRAGFMGQPVWGTLAEHTGSALGIGRNEPFEILLGGEGLPIPGGAVSASFREYYFDWTAAEPATFAIECLDDVVPARPTAESITAALEDAAGMIEHSIEYWNQYMLDHRAAGVDNTFSEPHKVAKGLDLARYSFCFWDLGPDDALLMESDVPPAPYWSIQPATLAWFESFDFGHRQVSLNHAQAVVSSDGRLRVVVAHEDPGVPNWIDSEGRREALLTFRWFWDPTPPQIRTRVVPLAELRASLPADTPSITPSDRRAEIAAHRAHVDLRFRT